MQQSIEIWNALEQKNQLTGRNFFFLKKMLLLYITGWLIHCKMLIPYIYSLSSVVLHIISHLCCKGFTTTTCLCSIWVLEGEASTNQSITVVQLHPKYEKKALWITNCQEKKKKKVKGGYMFKSNSIRNIKTRDYIT